MFMFLIIAATAIVVVVLLLPVFSGKQRDAGTQRYTINVAAAAARLSELQEEHRAGHINEEQFQRYRSELEAMTLKELQDFEGNVPENDAAAMQAHSGGDVLLALVLALAIPSSALLVYSGIGSEQAIFGSPAMPADHVPQHPDGFEKMLATAETKVRENPDDLEGRIILGRVYVEMERYSDAASIYKEAYQLRPRDPDVLVSYADALGRAHQRLSGRPTELLREALEIDPRHNGALWLAGFAELQKDNKAEAAAHWQRLLAQLETGSEHYRQVEAMIDELQFDVVAPSATASTGDSQAAIEVNVSLAPQFASGIDPDTVMFVFARASEGPPMPLAVYRGLAKELPLTVTLDDSMAMMPQMSLSDFPKVIVGARLSSNGQPQGQPGDPEGFSEVIETATTSAVNVLVDGVKP